MNLDIKNFFKFSTTQRKGIVSLFIIIILLQTIIFFDDFTNPEKNSGQSIKWLAFQSQIDSLKSVVYNYEDQIHSFNPNFLTDFNGYKLGMKPTEIDRLLAFRKSNKYVNSPKEFQMVTKISDSLLAKITPYFKFKDWINNKKSNTYITYLNNKYSVDEKIVVIDINVATKEDLMKISGIGDAISDRILTEKDKLGNFVSMDQLNDIYGISPELIKKINVNFNILHQPNFKKININTATLKELLKFPYFSNGLAKKIIIYRSMNGDFKNIESLTVVKDFPVNKIKIIALYLTL